MSLFKKKTPKNDIQSQTSSSAPFCTSLCFFDGRQPSAREGDYLVFIDNAEIPVILTWDGDCFVDELNDPYPVYCWAFLPPRPPLHWFEV